MMTNVLAIVMTIVVSAALALLFFYLLPMVFMGILIQEVEKGGLQEGDKNRLQEYEEKTWKLFQAAPPLGDDIMTPLLLAMIYQETLNSEKDKD